MIRPLLRLALLVLTADRALAIRTVTQSDPVQGSHYPLLHWPTLVVKPYRTSIECAPTRNDTSHEEVLEVTWYRNEVAANPFRTYGSGAAQLNISDRFYRFRSTGSTPNDPDFRGFSGTWLCLFTTKVS